MSSVYAYNIRVMSKKGKVRDNTLMEQDVIIDAYLIMLSSYTDLIQC